MTIEPKLTTEVAQIQKAQMKIRYNYGTVQDTKSYRTEGEATHERILQRLMRLIPPPLAMLQTRMLPRHPIHGEVALLLGQEPRGVRIDGDDEEEDTADDDGPGACYEHRDPPAG